MSGSGLYRGRVESNKDPHSLGRVRVRIPSLHGIPNDEGDSYISTDNLPWATVATPFPSGYEYGSVVVPEVGSYVFILFETDSEYPVCIGGCYGKGASNLKPMGVIGEFDSSEDKYSESNGKWYTPARHDEVPTDYLKGVNKSNHEPTRSVIYQSPKGSSIVVDEKDDHETLSILDRLGQSLTFLSAVSKESNWRNSHARHGRSVLEEDTYELDELGTKPVGYVLKSLAGQLFRSITTKVRSVTELVNKHKYEGDHTASGVYTETSDDHTRIKVFSQTGDNVAVIEIFNGTDITVSNGVSKFHMDKSTTKIVTPNTVIVTNSLTSNCPLVVDETLEETVVPESAWSDSKIEVDY